MMSFVLALLTLGAAPAKQAATPGLKGEYWGPGTTIPTSPGVPSGAPNVTRVDQTVDFANATFVAPFANADNFVIRWTGFVRGPATGTVTFFTNTDDGVQLTVDSQILINDWQDQAPVDNQGNFDMVQGAWYAIRLSFYERGGGAECHLSWSYPGQARVVIPSGSMSATAPPLPAAPTVSIDTPPQFSPVISLTWTAVPNATGYNVLRGFQSGTETPLATVAGGNTTYSDSAVLWQTTYFYVAQAVVGPQTGATSNEVSGTPQPLPPRTSISGSEVNRCGWGSTRPSGPGILAAIGLLVLIWSTKDPRRGSTL